MIWQDFVAGCFATLPVLYATNYDGRPGWQSLAITGLFYVGMVYGRFSR